MKSSFLLVASSFLLVSNAVAGSRHSHRISDAGEWNSAVIRIPGSLKKKPIEFTAGIGPPVVATLDFELTEARTANVALGEKRAVVLVRASGASAQSATETAQKFVLLNPRVVTGIGTAIPLEAEVLLTRSSGSKQAKVNSILPDSIAAWRRLREWPDLKNPRSGKGVSASTITRADKAAEAIRLSVQRIFEAGDLENVEDEDLLQKYEELSDSLRAASDENTDFDVSRQIAIAVTGVRGERLAWEQAWEQNLPVLNSRYHDYSKAATDESDSRSTDQATHPKASTSFDDSGTNRYKGYEDLQRRYPTVAYRTTYQQARATVAVCEQDQAFASGTIIGRNLILTCAHAVVRSGRGGSPPARDRDVLRAKIGYEFPDDKESPQQSLPATIIFEGLVQDDNADPLDFALLTAPIEEQYNTTHFEAAQERIKGILGDSTLSKDDKMKRIKDATFLPIEPLPLANYNYKESSEFDIAGHPHGGPKLVCGHGKIFYPFHLDQDRRDELFDSIVKKDSVTPQKQAALSQMFRAMYPDKTDSKGGTWYQYTYGNRSPGIGVICTTVGGNSGGAAVADSRPARLADNSDPRCVIGILVEGQSGSPDPWEPGMEHHEILLPVTAIIKQLDAEFTTDANGVPFQERWDKQYAVTILQKGKNGKVARRP